MADYEKLGVFYLGKEYDIQKKEMTNEPILFKSKDLTTHAVIIGMTGSGKTGLGIGMIEEAAIDNIPVIAIDPKGDLGNLALTFPNLRAEDFLPWINVQEAENKGLSPDEYAQAQADLWRKGIADFDQSEQRIQLLRQSADVTVYTPGGSAGVGVSVLKSFEAPSLAFMNDADAYRDRISITTTGLLSLIGIAGDPFTSREHILVANILEHSWNLGLSLGLPELIASIQNPPISKVGVMDMESFFPSKDRFALAMMFNNLLASPSFKVWMEGEPLDVGRFLYDAQGKPRISVFSIAHLSESERMFFVTMLLNEVLTWMRAQPGTASLRAMLYMDELFGYMPPTANPPSKAPLLTLLKQARAYGLGLVLSTQNPVDLDYKALSNAGTWFIGRLQTERDKDRVMAGLEGAAAGGSFDRAGTERILAGLSQRIFYLHSVHEDEPVLFGTRFVLSYMAGPLTREQIANLPGNRPMQPTWESQDAGHALFQGEQRQVITQSPSFEQPMPKTEAQMRTSPSNRLAPVLAPAIKQVFLPPKEYGMRDIVYTPYVIGSCSVLYSSAKHGVSESKEYSMLAPLREGPLPVDWSEAELLEYDLRDLDTAPIEGATYNEYPEAAAVAKSYDNWQKSLSQHIRLNLGLTLYTNPKLKLVSMVGEDERDFRIRLQHRAHEQRDEEIAALKKKYASKVSTLENRETRAIQALEKQNLLSKQRKVEAAISTGNALMGALLGTKAISATSVSRMSTAAKSTNRALRSGQAIGSAQENLENVQQELMSLHSEMDAELDRIKDRYDEIVEFIETVDIKAQSSNIAIHLVGLAWVPGSAS